LELLENKGGVEGADGVRTVRLCVPAGPEWAPLARLALAGLARVRAMDPDTLAELKLALTEAVSGSAQGEVDIRFVLLADRVAVQIEPRLP
jgi:hypothetical protein